MSIKAQIPARDITREHCFLAAAAGFASPSEFVEHCTRRLVQGQVEFGSRWAGMTLDQFAAELMEEGADLGAWAALADQKADLEHLPAELRTRVAVLLQRAARRGAQAHFDAVALRQLLSEHQPTLVKGREQS